jgi:tetratricopeptide (TPR) repeat protein
MLGFIKGLFKRRKAERDPSIPVEELWHCDFSRQRECRFKPETGDGYASSLGKEGLALALDRKGLFAWSSMDPWLYSDFCLDFEFSLGEGAVDCAAGMLLRMADEKSFLSVMVSAAGYFRLDSVLNGSPMPLIPWTEAEASEDGIARVRVIARGERITVIVNGRWAGEAEEEGLARGGLAFAAQNYGTMDSMSATLKRLSIESRPSEVEVLHYRYGSFVKAEPIARYRLAESLAASGLSLAALVQLRRLWRYAPAARPDLMLGSACALALGLHDEAEGYLAKLVGMDPADAEARKALAQLHYLRGRYVELDEACAALEAEGLADHVVANLRGHAAHNLGRFEDAAARYRLAAEAARAAGSDAWPLYLRNAGNSLDAASATAASRAKDGAEAASRLAREAAGAWLESARGFYSLGDMGEAAASLSLYRSVDDKEEAEGADVLEAALMYWDGRTREALARLERLVSRGCNDPVASYLLGLERLREDRPAEAEALFSEAIRLEPGKGLYFFRRAEARRQLGKECKADIDEALRLDPSEGWILNLAGLERLDAGDAEAARAYFAKAREALPAEAEPAINEAAALAAAGKREEALAALSAYPDAAEAWNQRGGVLAAMGRLDEALEAYGKALSLAPLSHEYRVNKAALLIEMDYIPEADDELRRALELRESKRALLLVARVASEKGEPARAEVALARGLELYPGDRDIRFAQALRLANLGRAAKALPIIEALAKEEGSARAIALRDRVRAELYGSLACAHCGRRWWHPKEPADPGQLRVRAAPPPETPAGRCAACGKVSCIACAKEDEGRLSCPSCGGALKLSDAPLRWLVAEALKGMGGREC